MLKEYNGLKVGDKVKVIDNGETYACYESLYIELSSIHKNCGKFIEYGDPKNEDIGVIIAMEKRPTFLKPDEVCVLVKIENQAYIIGIKGLEKVVEDKQVYFILDKSGSMDLNRNKIAKSIYDKYVSEYHNVKIITHTMEAKFITDEDDILKYNKDSGGYFSSGLKLAIKDSMSNHKDCIFVQVSDGDNWTEDNERFLNAVEMIENTNHEYHYFETLPSTYATTMYERLNKRFKESKNIKLEKFENEDKANEYLDIEVVTEPVKKYKVYLVEHKVGGKKYEFRSQFELRKREMVVCVTSKGNTYGRIKEIKNKQMTETEYLKLAICEYIR